MDINMSAVLRAEIVPSSIAVTNDALRPLRHSLVNVTKVNADETDADDQKTRGAVQGARC